MQSSRERGEVEEMDNCGVMGRTKRRVVKTVPAADANPGDIVDVYQLGYRQDDRVLREAQVVVADEPPADGEADPNGEGSQNNRGDDES
jgi:molecular chaperone GrpE (heat shock protein)